MVSDLRGRLPTGRGDDLSQAGREDLETRRLGIWIKRPPLQPRPPPSSITSPLRMLVMGACLIHPILLVGPIRSIRRCNLFHIPTTTLNRTIRHRCIHLTAPMVTPIESTLMLVTPIRTTPRALSSCCSA